jgi:hypothetical protein
MKVKLITYDGFEKIVDFTGGNKILLPYKTEYGILYREFLFTKFDGKVKEAKESKESFLDYIENFYKELEG